MSLRTPAQYVAALKAEGCRVTAHAGWTSVNRPGGWDPHGVVVHHTGPYATVAGMIDMLRKGRPDLPGPLAHAGGRPDGIIDLVGWFDTNHAGLGAQNVLDAVLGDKPTPKPGPDAVDGNANFYGLELINAGAGHWPPAQVEAAVRYCAAICRLHGWQATSVIFHRTWTKRKPDPAGLDLPTFQGMVAQRLKHPAGWAPPLPAPKPPVVVLPPKPPIVVVPSPPVVPDVEPASLDGAIVKVTELFDYLARLKAGA